MHTTPLLLIISRPSLRLRRDWRPQSRSCRAGPRGHFPCEAAVERGFCLVLRIIIEEDHVNVVCVSAAKDLNLEELIRPAPIDCLPAEVSVIRPRKVARLVDQTRSGCPLPESPEAVVERKRRPLADVILKDDPSGSVGVAKTSSSHIASVAVKKVGDGCRVPVDRQVGWLFGVDRPNARSVVIP